MSHHKLIKTPIIGALFLVCAQVYADSYHGFHDASAVYYANPLSGTEYNFFNRDLVPIHLMDDSTLFLAAEAERDTSMAINVRLLNNRWLASNQSNTYEGTRALRYFLKFNLKSYWENRNGDKEEIEISHDPLTNTLFISNISNYSLSVSEDRFVVRYKQRFTIR